MSLVVTCIFSVVSISCLLVARVAVLVLYFALRLLHTVTFHERCVKRYQDF